jgi:hypothetical protein
MAQDQTFAFYYRKKLLPLLDNYGDWMNAGFSLINSAVHTINKIAEATHFGKRARLNNGTLAIG